MGLSQRMQTRLTPAPADPTQAAIMNWLAVIFTFSLAKFSGRPRDLLDLE